MAVIKFTVMRKRRADQPDARWVEMGLCVVNTTDLTGTLYLHALDYNLQLFEAKGRTKPAPAADVPEEPTPF